VYLVLKTVVSDSERKLDKTHQQIKTKNLLLNEGIFSYNIWVPFRELHKRLELVYNVFIMDSLKNLKPEQQQRDDAPGNFREKQVEKLTRFLRLTFLEIFNNRKIEDVLKDEEAIRKLVTEISNEEYVSVLGVINSVLRNKPKEEFGLLDGEGVKMGDMDIFPTQEDKLGLLAKSLDGAKEMIVQNRAMEDVAILLSSLITAIHPFVDGNGRTAKTILILLMKGFNEDVLKTILSDNDNYSNLVNSGELSSMAFGFLEETFVPSNEFESFETYMESREFKRKQVEIMIDIIVNENDYKIESVDGGEIYTRFSVHKEGLEEYGKFSNFRNS